MTLFPELHHAITFAEARRVGLDYCDKWESAGVLQLERVPNGCGNIISDSNSDDYWLLPLDASRSQQSDVAGALPTKLRSCAPRRGARSWLTP